MDSTAETTGKKARIRAFIAGVVFGAATVLGVLGFLLTRIEDKPVEPRRPVALPAPPRAEPAPDAHISYEPPPAPPGFVASGEARSAAEPQQDPALAQPAPETPAAPAPIVAQPELPAPVVEPFVAEQVSENGKFRFHLKWSEIEEADGYEVEWSADADFTRTKKFLTDAPEKTISVSKKMDYAVRVRAIREGGESPSAFSEPRIAAYPEPKLERLPASRKKKTTIPLPPKKAKRKLATAPPPAKRPAPAQAAKTPASVAPEATEVTPVKPGSPPLLTHPEPSATLVIAEHRPPPIEFRWATAPNAVKYELQLASDGDFFNVIETVSLRRARHSVSKPLPEGRVFWRVRAITRTGMTKWSEPADVEILYK